METLELSQEEISLLAIAAANIAGGRHEFRADSAIREESAELVAKSRKRKRNESRREAYRWRNVGERFAFDIGYGETDSDRIAAWQDALKSRPFHDATMRRIARVLFGRDEFDADVVENWREKVRAYSAWRDNVAAIGMVIPLSLADMRADHGSRFFNYAVRKWNTFGYPADLFGSDVQDAFQDGMVACLENGDWTGKEHRPAYGALWRHMALAVRRAVWRNTRFTYHAAETPFSWEEWEKTANDAIPAVAFRTDSANRQSLNEWAEYTEWRAIRDAMQATRERIASEREERMHMLTESRRAIATLINGGMTIQRIANLLGRNVESLASDLSGEPLALATRFLPERGRTESEIAESAYRNVVRKDHADTLRVKNYAATRVQRLMARGWTREQAEILA